MTNLPLFKEEFEVVRTAMKLAPLLPLKVEDRQLNEGLRFPTLIDNGGHEVGMTVTVVGESRDEILVSGDHTAHFIAITCNYYERLVNTVDKLAEIAGKLIEQEPQSFLQAVEQLTELGYYGQPRQQASDSEEDQSL